MTHAVTDLFRKVTCASPVCTAWINVRTTYTLATGLRLKGWRLEQQDGDDQPEPYLPEVPAVTAARDVQTSMFPELVPERPQGWIMPSVFTGTNAELIAAIAPMYLTGSVLDVTYGNGDTAGGWWRKFTPAAFTFHDLAGDGVDFRALPEDDATIDAVCFDPPYVTAGGDSSALLRDQQFQHRYGIGTNRHGCTTGRMLDDLILGGLEEALRVARRFVLVKCMEYAQGSGLGGFHDVPHIVTVRAAERGWPKHDQIVHHTGSGPGGHNIFTPKRARRHHSYLIVFTRAPK